MQEIKVQVSDLLNKQMDRQDFLKHVAIGLVALTGASTALRLLSPKQHTVDGGYGSAAYGGSEDSQPGRR